MAALKSLALAEKQLSSHRKELQCRTNQLPIYPLPFPPFIYGTATSKMMAGENAGEILDAAFEAGITTFDTARLYGKAESVLGDWVRRRNLRGKVNILTKGCHPDNDKRRPLFQRFFRGDRAHPPVGPGLRKGDHPLRGADLRV